MSDNPFQMDIVHLQVLLDEAIKIMTDTIGII